MKSWKKIMLCVSIVLLLTVSVLIILSGINKYQNQHWYLDYSRLDKSAYDSTDVRVQTPSGEIKELSGAKVGKFLASADWAWSPKKIDLAPNIIIYIDGASELWFFKDFPVYAKVVYKGSSSKAESRMYRMANTTYADVLDLIQECAE